MQFIDCFVFPSGYPGYANCLMEGVTFWRIFFSLIDTVTQMSTYVTYSEYWEYYNQIKTMVMCGGPELAWYRIIADV